MASSRSVQIALVALLHVLGSSVATTELNQPDACQPGFVAVGGACVPTDPSTPEATPTAEVAEEAYPDVDEVDLDLADWGVLSDPLMIEIGEDIAEGE